MRKLIAIAGAVALAGAMAAPAVATQPDDDGIHKNWICHATGSAKNPWVLIPPDKAANGAHAKHQGDKDIIVTDVAPPFDLPKNRAEKKAIIADFCEEVIG